MWFSIYHVYSDVLTNLVINKNTSHFDKYIKPLNEDCKVSFHTYQNKESKNLKWRDLTGRLEHSTRLKSVI